MVNGEVHAAVNGCKNPGGVFLFNLLRVCAFMCLFDVMSEKCDVHTAVLAAALSQPGKLHYKETTAPL